MTKIAFKRAEKKRSKLRLALQGPAGSGKTYSGLAIAEGLGGRVALLDSERGSASLYADRFEFDVFELEDLRAESYIEAISAAAEAGIDVLIIDSLSHAWEDLKDRVEPLAKAKFRGNTWAAWSVLTPIQNALIRAVLTFPGHVIATMRSKTAWEQGEGGGKKPKKVGLAAVQREGVDYEFTIVLEMSQGGFADVGKTRWSEIEGKTIERPGADFARRLLEWLGSGAPDVQREAVEGRAEPDHRPEPAPREARKRNDEALHPLPEAAPPAPAPTPLERARAEFPELGPAYILDPSDYGARYTEHQVAHDHAGLTLGEAATWQEWCERHARAEWKRLTPRQRALALWANELRTVRKAAEESDHAAAMQEAKDNGLTLEHAHRLAAELDLVRDGKPAPKCRDLANYEAGELRAMTEARILEIEKAKPANVAPRDVPGPSARAAKKDEPPRGNRREADARRAREIETTTLALADWKAGHPDPAAAWSRLCQVAIKEVVALERADLGQLQALLDAAHRLDGEERAGLLAYLDDWSMGFDGEARVKESQRLIGLCGRNVKGAGELGLTDLRAIKRALDRETSGAAA